MGAGQSSDRRKLPLADQLDFIAANYILTTNFKDMANLSDPKYCNNLVILTSKIIAKNLKDLDIEFMSQRLKNNKEVNILIKDKVIVINKKILEQGRARENEKEEISELDTPGEKNEGNNLHNSYQQRRLCIGIAKKYVSVAHLFAAIITTINPKFRFKDENNTEQVMGLSEKADIPLKALASAKIEQSLCGERFNVLKNNINYNVGENQPMTISIGEKFCALNDTKTSLKSEAGMPELEKLYYDEYDFDKGEFKMSENMRNTVYTRDVEFLYRAFSGNNEIPVENGVKTIRRFEDIKLRDYKQAKICRNGKAAKKYTGTLKERLFRQYADHLNTMMNNTNNKQAMLLEVIDVLFIEVMNNKTGRYEISINPTLTDKIIAEQTVKTQTIIRDLYISCEDDFLTGILIFESITETQLEETSQQSKKLLEARLMQNIHNG